MQLQIGEVLLDPCRLRRLNARLNGIVILLLGEHKVRLAPHLLQKLLELFLRPPPFLLRLLLRPLLLRYFSCHPFIELGSDIPLELLLLEQLAAVLDLLNLLHALVLALPHLLQVRLLVLAQLRYPHQRPPLLRENAQQRLPLLLLLLFTDLVLTLELSVQPLLMQGLCRVYLAQNQLFLLPLQHLLLLADEYLLSVLLSPLSRSFQLDLPLLLEQLLLGLLCFFALLLQV